MHPILFTGLYHLKTLPKQDWAVDFDAVKRELTGGMSLFTIKHKQLITLDEGDSFLNQTKHQKEYSTYVGIDEDDVLVLKTPDYVSAQAETNILATLLNMLGVKTDLTNKLMNQLPDIINAFPDETLTLVSSFLDFPIVVNPEQFYTAFNKVIHKNELAEEALINIFKYHPYSTKIPQSADYDELLKSASEQGLSQLLLYLYTARTLLFPHMSTQVRYQIPRVVKRGQLEEIEKLEETLVKLDYSKEKAQLSILAEAMKQGKYKVSDHYYQKMKQPELEDDLIKSILLNPDFEITQHYFNYFDWLNTYPSTTLTSVAVHRLINKKDDQLIKFLQKNDRFNLDYWAFSMIANKSNKEFSHYIDQFLKWGYTINQFKDKDNKNHEKLPTLAHHLTLGIGELFGTSYREGLIDLKNDKQRLPKFKKMQIIRKLGADFSIKNNAGHTVWEGIGMTEQEFFDLLDSELVNSENKKEKKNSSKSAKKKGKR